MALTSRQRSIHNKNNSKRASFSKGKRKPSEGDIIVTSAPSDLRNIGYPGGAAALGFLITARLLAAFYGHISDCDETYNYWEPLHYLVYGSGLQTWEYSPTYAIRSYMPLWFFAIPAKLLSYIMQPVSVFYTLKAVLGVLTAWAELAFYKAVCHEFGVHVGRVWFAFALCAAGSFAASAALLPSAWSSALCGAALACWWRRRYPPAVALTAATALLSWPFTALIGLPIAIDMVILKREYTDFFKYALISLVVILIPTIIVDSLHYGKFVVAPWNIVAYNIFTEHGPDLYGTEPWTYYFVNGFLNFNIVWLLALYCPLALYMCYVTAPRSTARAPFCSPYWLNLMPLALWLAVFMAQPHKEERFLYPVYSMIILAGAISVDCIQKMVYTLGVEVFKSSRFNGTKHYLSYTMPLMVLFTVTAGIAGVSRITALYNNYHAPMSLLRHLPPAPARGAELTACFGKEWYRSPSSFHLPDGYRIRFIQTEFDGQMPAPYADAWNATRLVHPYFNDKNRGDDRTYLKPSLCHYLVDSDIGQPSTLEPAYYRDTSVWEVTAHKPMIDSEKSHKFFRAFYVPIFSERNTKFGTLYLLKNRFI